MIGRLILSHVRALQGSHHLLVTLRDFLDSKVVSIQRQGDTSMVSSALSCDPDLYVTRGVGLSEAMFLQPISVASCTMKLC